MRTVSIALALTIFSLLLGCKPAPERIEQPPNRGVAVYVQAENFTLPASARIGWNKQAGGALGQLQENHQIIDATVRGAVRDKLGAHGLALTDAPPYDFIMSYAVALDQDLDDKALFERFGMSTGMQSSGNYQKGALILDLQDPSNKQSMWRGVMQGAVAPKGTMELEQRQQRLSGAIHNMLSNLVGSGAG